MFVKSAVKENLQDVLSLLKCFYRKGINPYAFKCLFWKNILFTNLQQIAATRSFQRVEKRENEVILSPSASYLCYVLTAGQGEAMIGQSVCFLFERAQFSLQDVLKAFALCV